MNPELKELVGGIQANIESLHAAVNKKIEGLATAAEVDERTAKINAEFDQLKAKYDAELAAVRRQSAGNGLFGGADGAKLQAEADQFAAMVSGGRQTTMSVEKYSDYKRAFGAFLRRGTEIPSGILADMSVVSDPDGGYLVTPDMSGRIAKLVYETSPIRQIASAVTISTDALEGMNDLGEAASGWVAETETRATTNTPQIGKWRIPVYEQYANPRVTQKLLDDASVDVEAWINEKIADKLARTENTAFVSGDGNGKPRGFLTYSHGIPSSTTWNVIERIPSGASGGFLAATASPAVNGGDCLIDTVTALKDRFRQNAKWVMNRSTWGAVRKLKDVDGQFLFKADAMADGILTFRLLGFPVVEAEDMPDISSNSLSIAFGDFTEAYQIVDRTGIRLLRDPFTAKPYVQFYTTKRVGGDVVNFEAIKLVRFATAAA